MNKSQVHAAVLMLRHAHTVVPVHTYGSHTYMTDPDSLLLFMAAPELAFKYIFHATLPPMAANEEKKGGRRGLRNEAGQ